MLEKENGCGFFSQCRESLSDVQFDGGSRASPSSGENWELMAATLFVKKLAKSFAVRG